jgi:hypothetical protein
VKSFEKFVFTCSNAVEEAGAPLPVQRCDPAAQLGDGGLEVLLLAQKGVVLLLHGPRVFLGAQVHRAQRVALPPETVDIGLHPVRARKRIGKVAEAFAQSSGVDLQFLRDAGGGGLHGLARGIAAGLSGGAGLARFGCGTFRGAFARDGLRIGAFRPGERIRGLRPAGFGIGNALAERGAPRLDLRRAGARDRERLLRLGLAAREVVQLRFGRRQPVTPRAQLIGDGGQPPLPQLPLALQLVMFAASRQHRHARGVHGHPRIGETGPNRVEILKPRLLPSASATSAMAVSTCSAWRRAASRRVSSRASSVARFGSARVCARLAAARLVSA